MIFRGSGAVFVDETGGEDASGELSAEELGTDEWFEPIFGRKKKPSLSEDNSESRPDIGGDGTGGHGGDVGGSAAEDPTKFDEAAHDPANRLPGESEGDAASRMEKEAYDADRAQREAEGRP
jgi:hypothetical protein